MEFGQFLLVGLVLELLSRFLSRCLFGMFLVEVLAGFFFALLNFSVFLVLTYDILFLMPKRFFASLSDSAH